MWPSFQIRSIMATISKDGSEPKTWPTNWWSSTRIMLQSKVTLKSSQRQKILVGWRVTQTSLASSFNLSTRLIQSVLCQILKGVQVSHPSQSYCTSAIQFGDQYPCRIQCSTNWTFKFRTWQALDWARFKSCNRAEATSETVRRLKPPPN